MDNKPLFIIALLLFAAAPSHGMDTELDISQIGDDIDNECLDELKRVAGNVAEGVVPDPNVGACRIAGEVMCFGLTSWYAWRANDAGYTKVDHPLVPFAHSAPVASTGIESAVRGITDKMPDGYWEGATSPGKIFNDTLPTVPKVAFGYAYADRLGTKCPRMGV